MESVLGHLTTEIWRGCWDIWLLKYYEGVTNNYRSTARVVGHVQRMVGGMSGEEIYRLW